MTTTVPATLYFDGYVELLNGEGVVPIQLYFEEGWGTNAYVSHEYRDDIDGTVEDFSTGVGNKLFINLEDFKNDVFTPVEEIWRNNGD